MYVSPVNTARRVAVRASRRDPPAGKYCFSARCAIRPNILSSATIGVVFSYDKRPSVSRDVEDVAAIFCREAGYVPGTVDLYLHEQCPVEIENEVFVTVFKSPTETDISLDQMHAIAIQQQFHIPKPSASRHGTESDSDDDDDDNNNSTGGGGSSPPGDGGGGGGGSLPRRPTEPKDDGGIALALP